MERESQPQVPVERRFRISGRYVSPACSAHCLQTCRLQTRTVPTSLPL
jgi:hypothetical protein